MRLALEHPVTLAGRRRRLGDIGLGAITRRHLIGLIEQLRADGRSPSDVRNAVKPLQAIFRKLHEDGVLAVNPALRLPLERAVTRRQRIADETQPDYRIVAPEDVPRLLEPLPAMVRCFWALAFYAGLRLGELRGLRWQDITDGELVLRRQINEMNDERPLKGREPGETRRVPILAQLQPELRAWRLACGRREGLVLGTDGTQPFTAAWITKLTRRAWSRLEPAPPAKLTPHMARHTFGSILAASSVPPSDIGLWMGQSSEEVRALYIHEMPDAMDRARRLVEAYLQGR
jgi:integrase